MALRPAQAYCRNAAAATHVCRRAHYLPRADTGGRPLRRETELTDLQVRDGSTGTLIVTTQTRRTSTPRGLAMTEEGDTVFREEVKPGAKSGIPKREEVPAGLPWRRTIKAGPVVLFRFSALTGNPHRIHYDRPYAMEVEGYPGLVVHGPFTQACLIDFVRDNNPGRTIKTPSCGRAPRCSTRPRSISRASDRRWCGLRSVGRHAGGTVAMQASATLA